MIFSRFTNFEFQLQFKKMCKEGAYWGKLSVSSSNSCYRLLLGLVWCLRKCSLSG